MSNHPVNLAIRFILELIAFFSPGYWAWKTQIGWHRIPLTILLPIAIAVLWGVFAVPDDPSRSGKTLVRTPGIVRLLIELFVFAIGTLAVYQSGYTRFALIFCSIVCLHYVLSYDRIKWLFKQ